jgi:hypothetical protein
MSKSNAIFSRNMICLAAIAVWSKQNTPVGCGMIAVYLVVKIFDRIGVRP